MKDGANSAKEDKNWMQDAWVLLSLNYAKIILLLTMMISCQARSFAIRQTGLILFFMGLSARLNLLSSSRSNDSAASPRKRIRSNITIAETMALIVESRRLSQKK
jgi:hypothetical protein